MEEKIVSYLNINEVQKIVKTNTKQNFIFVGHNTDKKILFFKKINSQPHTWLED